MVKPIKLIKTSLRLDVLDVCWRVVVKPDILKLFSYQAGDLQVRQAVVQVFEGTSNIDNKPGTWKHGRPKDVVMNGMNWAFPLPKYGKSVAWYLDVALFSNLFTSPNSKFMQVHIIFHRKKQWKKMGVNWWTVFLKLQKIHWIIQFEFFKTWTSWDTP